MRAFPEDSFVCCPLPRVAIPSHAEDIAKHFKAIVKALSIVSGEARTARTQPTGTNGAVLTGHVRALTLEIEVWAAVH